MNLIFSWDVIKGLSENPIGKLSPLIPFIPFVADFLATLLNGVEWVESFLPFADAISTWVRSNLISVSILYFGIVFFAIARVTYSVFAPKMIKDFESKFECQRYFLELKELAIKTEDKSLASHYSFILSDLDGNYENRKIRLQHARLSCSALFSISFVLLAASPISKFISMIMIAMGQAST